MKAVHQRSSANLQQTKYHSSTMQAAHSALLRQPRCTVLCCSLPTVASKHTAAATGWKTSCSCRCTASASSSSSSSNSNSMHGHCIQSFSSSSSSGSRRQALLAAGAVTDPGELAHAHHPLIDWVVQSGGAVNGVGVANLAGSDGGAGYGLVATQAVSQLGTRLIELPRSCHLTYDESSDPRVLQLIQQVPDELWGAKLALQVLVARIQGQDSPYAHYVANLPVGVAGVPMFFPRGALEALEYPPVVEQVKKRSRWLHRFSLDVLSKLPHTPADPFGGVTIDINSLGWALAVVTSRAFRVAGPSAPAALLPLIDMANHSFEPNCEVLPVPGGVAMVAKRQISAGQPLLLSYGPLSNDFLLMDYGFVVPSNPHDRVALRFDLNLINVAAEVGGAVGPDGSLLELSAAAPWRQTLLKKLGLSNDQKSNLQVLLGGPSLLEPRLLAAVRALVATYQSEVESLTLEVLGSWERPLNKQNEVATLRILMGMALVALQNFSTSLDHDKMLMGVTALSESPSDHNSANGSSSSNSTATTTSSSSTSSSDLTAATGEDSSSSSVHGNSSHSNGADGSNAPGGTAAAAAAAAAAAGNVDTQQQQQPLGADMQLAVMFRSEKKQLLVDVISGLASRLQQVPNITGLRASPVVAAKKGQKPKPATKKGFGS